MMHMSIFTVLQVDLTQCCSLLDYVHIYLPFITPYVKFSPVKSTYHTPRSSDGLCLYTQILMKVRVEYSTKKNILLYSTYISFFQPLIFLSSTCPLIYIIPIFHPTTFPCGPLLSIHLILYLQSSNPLNHFLLLSIYPLLRLLLSICQIYCLLLSIHLIFCLCLYMLFYSIYYFSSQLQ